MYHQTKIIHSNRPIDLIHCRSYQAALIGKKMKTNCQIPWLFDMRGFWADERVDGGIWKLSNPIYKFIYNYYKKKEIDFLIDSDAVISLTENGKNEILSWQSNQNSPIGLKKKQLDITVIPCCVDIKLFNPEKTSTELKTELRTSLKILPNQFVLGYVGSIGTWYMLPEMLDFFNELKKVKPESIFLFITNEPVENIFEIAKQKNISENNLRIKSCLHKEVPIYISLFDISIFFILPAYSKKASSPTKQAELMSMGIPIICNVGVGDSDIIVEKYNAGWIIENFTNDNYLKIITEIESSNFSEFNHLYTSCKEIFQLEKGADLYNKTFQRILNDKPFQ